DAAAVGRKGHAEDNAVDRAPVCLEPPEFLAAFHVPQPHRVDAAGEGAAAVGGEADAEGAGLGPFEAAELLTGFQAPQPPPPFLITGEGPAAGRVEEHPHARRDRAREAAGSLGGVDAA